MLWSRRQFLLSASRSELRTSRASRPRSHIRVDILGASRTDGRRGYTGAFQKAHRVPGGVAAMLDPKAVSMRRDGSPEGRGTRARPYSAPDWLEVRDEGTRSRAVDPGHRSALQRGCRSRPGWPEEAGRAKIRWGCISDHRGCQDLSAESGTLKRSAWIALLSPSIRRGWLSDSTRLPSPRATGSSQGAATRPLTRQTVQRLT